MSDLPYIVLPEERVELCVAKNDVRYYLQWPYLDLRGDEPMLVATNGHILAAAPVEVVGDFPQGPLPVIAIKVARKSKEGNLYLENGRVGTLDAMYKRPEDHAKYPQWTNVVPDIGKRAADIGVNARYLATAQEVLNSTNAVSPGLAVWFSKEGTKVHGDKQFVVRGVNGTEGFCCVMPMRL